MEGRREEEGGEERKERQVRGGHLNMRDEQYLLFRDFHCGVHTVFLHAIK